MSASSPGLYSLDVQYFRRTVFPRELGPGGGGPYSLRGIRSAGPKIGGRTVYPMTPANCSAPQTSIGENIYGILTVADPENKAGGFTTTVRKSLHVTSIRGRVREGDVPPPARSAEAQRCSTICGRYLIEKSARQSTFNLA